MTFVADEGVERQIVDQLRADGHDVAYVAEMSPSVSDEVVLELGREKTAVLITSDKDFGGLVFMKRLTSAGVLLLRLSGLTPRAKAMVVSAAVRDHASQLAGSFAVLDPGKIRFRRDPLQ